MQMMNKINNEQNDAQCLNAKVVNFLKTSDVEIRCDAKKCIVRFVQTK